jgi:hypothetical protein
VCGVVVDELALSGAVVSVMASSAAGSGPSGAIAAASGDPARLVDELEFSLGEGPRSDAFRTSRPVLTPDLERAIGRWPGYAPAACAAGTRAVFAFPMHVGASCFGVLSMHMSGPRSLTGSEITTSLMLTELATEIVLDGYTPLTDGSAPELPPLGIDRLHDQVYQAQGMVSVQLGVGLPEALALLRAHAFATGQELTELAADVLAGRAHTFPPRDGAP